MLWGVDSEFPHPNPGELVTLGYRFGLGYLGGRAARVWQPWEFRQYAAAGLKTAPIWVSPSADTGYQAGVDNGNQALSAMQAYGLSEIVLVDVEEDMAPVPWLQGFVAAAHAGDCCVGLYGRRSALLSAPSAGVDVWWLADWQSSGQQLTPAAPDWSMWQYASGPQFDYNVARDDFPFAGVSF